MKVWSGYGSEHSMNLVMIGSFKQASDAEDVKDLIAQLSTLAQNEPNRSFNDDPRESRFRAFPDKTDHILSWPGMQRIPIE
jgi:uncharacterized protein DUF6375